MKFNSPRWVANAILKYTDKFKGNLQMTDSLSWQVSHSRTADNVWLYYSNFHVNPLVVYVVADQLMKQNIQTVVLRHAVSRQKVSKFVSVVFSPGLQKY